MGNCWPKPVDNLPSTNISKVFTPAQNDDTTSRSTTTISADAGNTLSTAPNHIIKPNLKKFTYSELNSATRNFRPGTVVGEGGFGRVFKGWIDEKTFAPCKVGMGIPVAVKKSNPDSTQGLKEWQAEVTFLGKFSHPNLVKLLGFCLEDNEYLLVYEYIQKGSLESHLFTRCAEPLSWETRLKIAMGAARGLDFLHTTEKQVIYRDFKAANILVDRDYNAKLSDFGLATLGPADGVSHVTTRVIGTYGYAAPEYVATGHLYLRSDVYGFGVVLLEILTGRRVHDTNRPNGEQNLVDWARPYLANRKLLREIMDQKLHGAYPLEAAFQTAQLILQCLEAAPKDRPSMQIVLEALERISTVKMTTKELKTISRSTEQQHSRGSGVSHGHRHHRPPNYHNQPPLRFPKNSNA